MKRTLAVILTLCVNVAWAVPLPPSRLIEFNTNTHSKVYPPGYFGKWAPPEEIRNKSLSNSNRKN